MKTTKEKGKTKSKAITATRKSPNLLMIKNKAFIFGYAFFSFYSFAAFSQTLTSPLAPSPCEHQNDLTLSEEVLQKMNLFEQVSQSPKILMAAMEYGDLKVDGKNLSAKVGGLGAVVNDMIKEMPSFLKKQGNGQGELGLVFMAYDNQQIGKFVKFLSIDMAGKTEEVELREAKQENGVTLFFLQHPTFGRRSIRDKNKNLYTVDSTPYNTGKREWEEAYEFALFGKAIAQVKDYYQPNIVHLHDFHTAMAAVHVKGDPVMAMTIHNAGPGYQGTFYTPGYGPERVPYEHDPFGIPKGNFSDNDHFLKLLGIDFLQYKKFAEHDSAVNFLKMANGIIAQKNLVGGIPVSQGYEEELSQPKRSVQILSQIYAYKAGMPLPHPDKVYIPNGGVNFEVLDGIANGMSDRFDAKNHPFLKRKSPEELVSIHKAIQSEEDRHLWLEGFTYGEDLETPEGIQKVHQKKAELKALAQKVAGLPQDPKAPLFVLVSRFVDQKNIRVLANNLKHIVARGGQVILGGTPGDQEGREVAALVEKILQDPKVNPGGKPRIRFFNEFVNAELSALIQAGGDFTVITSKFEPCGLTDIEASKLGTLVLARRTGGLGKVQCGLYYNWLDTTNHQGEVQALRKTLDEAITLYQENPEEFKQRRIQGMKEDFSWERSFERYFQNYQSSALHKVITTLSENVQQGKITKDEAVQTLEAFVQKQGVVGKKALENYQRLLGKSKTKWWP